MKKGTELKDFKTLPVYNLGNPNLAAGFQGSRYTNFYKNETKVTDALTKLDNPKKKSLKQKKNIGDGQDESYL
jgi:hypothetical protein